MHIGNIKIGLLVAGLSLLFGCTSVRPFQANSSFPPDRAYKILGRVYYEGSIKRGGYLDLLEEAKKKYSETDDVVNIMVDRKEINILFLIIIPKYKLSGIAIEYIE